MRVTLLLALIATFASLPIPPDFAAEPAPRVYRVGYLTPFPRSFEASFIPQFEQTLADRGYVLGQNLSIIYKSAEGRDERLPELAASLLKLKIDVFVTHGTPATRAAQQATASIPIVMLTVLDPVNAGFVVTLSHPGGNITGSSELSEELIPKRLELLKEIVPKASLIAVIWDRTHPTNALDLRRTEDAAQRLGLRVRATIAHETNEFEKAFASIRQWHPDALLVLTSPAATGRMGQIAELARKSAIPMMYGARAGAEQGALVTYGPDFSDTYRHAAIFVDKILKGAKPAELPVEQPTRFELIINLKTAKALGITIPESILLRADEVIR